MSTSESQEIKQEEKIIVSDEKNADEGARLEKKVEEVVKEKEVAAAPPPAPRVHKTDFQKDVVYLYQFSRTPTLPSLSPYCLKVETWLRLNDIKYENVDHKLKFKSSKGQLPFVELNGEEITDSSLIISKLGKHFGVDTDAHLTREQQNFSHALISMIENHLCWVHVYWRSKNPDSMIKGYKISLQHVLGSRIPNALLNIFFKMTYARKGAKKVKAHGLGVHSGEEIFEFGKQDLEVLEGILGDTSFFFGDKPSLLDVVVFAHLSQISYVDKSVEYDTRDWMNENCPLLVKLLGSIKEQCFPDWDQILSTLKLNTHIPEPEPEEKKETIETVEGQPQETDENVEKKSPDSAEVTKGKD